MSTANQTQIGGGHYRSEYQHWDYVWRNGLGYFPGQITKYAMRWRKKNGAQDLEKAIHFAEKYTELLSEADARVAMVSSAARVTNEVRAFAAANPAVMDEATCQVFRLMTGVHDADSARVAAKILKAQLEELRASQATPAYVSQG